MVLVHARPRYWSVAQFQRLYDQGFFDPGERVELIEGVIVPMSPQNPPHSKAVAWATRTLTSAFNSTHVVRVQLPIDLSQFSQPEPDFSIVSLEDMRAVTGQPTFADLIIEVADTSLDYDRDEKGSLYACVGILDYWIINVRAMQLEVYRDPVPARARAFRFGYRTQLTLGLDDTVTPLIRSDVVLRVAELLDVS